MAEGNRTIHAQRSLGSCTLSGVRNTIASSESEVRDRKRVVSSFGLAHVVVKYVPPLLAKASSRRRNPEGVYPFPRLINQF